MPEAFAAHLAVAAFAVKSFFVCLDGYGHCKYSNGDKYSGCFKAGIRHGEVLLCAVFTHIFICSSALFFVSCVIFLASQNLIRFSKCHTSY